MQALLFCEPYHISPIRQMPEARAAHLCQFEIICRGMNTGSYREG